MKELFYIARIDVRPWIGAVSQIESLIPFVLFFASMEMTRYLFNSQKVIPQFERYFILSIVVVIVVYLSDPGRKPWRPAYTTKLMQHIFYTALVSSALFNAASVFFPGHWELRLDPNGTMADWLIRVTAAGVMVVFGIVFVAFRTERQRRAEYRRLAERPSARHFFNFRRKETRCLGFVYAAHYVAASALIAFLLIRNA